MDAYRSVLEVLKMTEPEHVLQSYNITCTLWYRCSTSSELWSSFCSDLSLSHTSSQALVAYKESAIARNCLVYVRRDKLYFFNCRRELWSRCVILKGEIEVTFMPAIAIISDGSVIVTGGVRPGVYSSMEHMDTATRVLGSGNLQHLNAMRDRRSGHSLISHRGFLYTFGCAKDKKTSASEKLSLLPLTDIVEREWMAVPDVPVVIVSCNLCAEGVFIYLCGRTSLATLNRFHTQAEKYEAFSTWQDNAPVRTAVVVNDEIVIFSPLKLIRWQITNPQEVSTADLTGVFTYSAQNPVSMFPKIFSIDQVSGLVYVLNLTTYESQRTQQLPIDQRK